MLTVAQLVDLKAPPVSINDPNSTGTLDGSTPLNGILGQILGESPEQQKTRLEEASKTANDLSGLVKRKKAPSTKPEPAEQTNGQSNGTAANSTNGKRRIEVADLLDEAVEFKKSKVEEA